jgi:hypothetical protein
MGACQDLMKELEIMILIKDIGNLVFDKIYKYKLSKKLGFRAK